MQVDASFPLDAHAQEQELTDTRFTMCSWLNEDTLALIFGKASHYLFMLKSVSKLWSTIIRGKIAVRTLTSVDTVMHSVALLKWARRKGIPWNVITCDFVARSGNFDVLQWAREHRCPWDSGTCAIIAGVGNLDVLQWAHEQGCPWDWRTCATAAERGHIHVLKWAHEQGCPWDENVCEKAAAGGHLDVLKWAREEGAPWDLEVCTEVYYLASANGHLHVLKWAHEEGMPWDEGVCEKAAFRRSPRRAEVGTRGGCAVGFRSVHRGVLPRVC